MKLRSSGILGLFCFASILAMDVKIDCKDVAMSGLMDAVLVLCVNRHQLCE